jgi:hypothetical protein
MVATIMRCLTQTDFLRTVQNYMLDDVREYLRRAVCRMIHEFFS